MDLYISHHWSFPITVFLPFFNKSIVLFSSKLNRENHEGVRRSDDRHENLESEKNTKNEKFHRDKTCSHRVSRNFGSSKDVRAGRTIKENKKATTRRARRIGLSATVQHRTEPIYCVLSLLAKILVFSSTPWYTTTWISPCYPLPTCSSLSRPRAIRDFL